MKFIQTGAVWSVEGEIRMFTNNTLAHKVCTRTVASLGAPRSEGKENTASLGTEARDSWTTHHGGTLVIGEGKDMRDHETGAGLNIC